MSGQGSSIVCRRCEEVVPLEAGNCPNCGQTIRSTIAPVIGIVLGAIFVVAALLGGSQLYAFGVLGALLVLIGGYLLYDKRRRIAEAATRGTTSEPASQDEGQEGDTIF